MNKRKATRISDHFSSKDFMCKCANCEGDLKLSLGLVGGLEMLRTLAKNRVEIIKGYICPSLQEAEKKLKKDYHAMGLAADIVVEGVSIVDVFKLAETIPEFKGIGINLTDKYVHVDTRKDPTRHTWVVSFGNLIELTPENRAQYINE